jgi:hypothetical protein
MKKKKNLLNTRNVKDIHTQLSIPYLGDKTFAMDMNVTNITCRERLLVSVKC